MSLKDGSPVYLRYWVISGAKNYRNIYHILDRLCVLVIKSVVSKRIVKKYSLPSHIVPVEFIASRAHINSSQCFAGTLCRAEGLYINTHFWAI